MNAQNAKDYLPLVAALAEGKTIQINNMGNWFDAPPNVDFTVPSVFYRIKPNPRRWWIVKWSEHKHDIAFCERGAQAMAAEFPERYCEIIPVEERTR